MDIKSLTISQRLRLFLDDLGIEQQDFADALGTSRQVVSNAVNGRTKYPKSDFLIQLIQAYPQFNIYWLLTGIGEMFINENSTSEEILNELDDLQVEISKLRNDVTIYHI
jgi:transcriptional regulator with XRE-family HTH domain